MSGESQPNFWSRLGKAFRWLFLTLIRFAVIILVVIGLVAAVLFGVSQINRVTQVTNRLNVVDLEMDNMASQGEAQQELISQMQMTIVTQESRLETMEDDLSSDLAQQSDLLATLESQVGSLLARTESISQSVTTLGAGLIILQGDINGNSGRIDELGGEVDNWQADVVALQGELDELVVTSQAPDEEMVRLQRSVALFYVGELITRARVRLVDNNPGLAVADIEQAALAVESLAATVSEDEATALIPLQARLALALSSLPADPATAAVELDLAWEEVGGVLSRLLVSESGLLEAGLPITREDIAAPEAPAAPEAAATPEGEATPEVQPTPSPTPEG